MPQRTKKTETILVFTRDATGDVESRTFHATCSDADILKEVESEYCGDDWASSGTHIAGKVEIPNNATGDALLALWELSFDFCEDNGSLYQILDGIFRSGICAAK